jgi:hypothetical protein
MRTVLLVWRSHNMVGSELIARAHGRRAVWESTPLQPLARLHTQPLLHAPHRTARQHLLMYICIMRNARALPEVCCGTSLADDL